VASVTKPVIDVDMWSDVVCPWCYIGKRAFEAAVAEVADEVDVRVHFRPYQLDPTARLGEPTPVFDAYSKKFGGPARAAQIIEHVSTVASGIGLEFRMDRALRANTFDAHRLLWLAGATGHQARLKERLLQAYFVDGLDVSDHDTLANLAAEVGMARAAVIAFLASDDGRDQVTAELRLAADHEITAVPTFVFGGTWQVPGAQDVDTFVTVLRRLAAKASASAIVNTSGQAPQ
jgi:predicted DsbA family dithiol-disulfide isomerase